MSSEDQSPPLLTLRKISKSYAVHVLQEVELELQQGEIHALVGANGAGKSTLCRILAGLTPATSGSMLLEGRPYRPAGKAVAEQQGVQIVQQELNLLPTLTVAENLFLNRMPRQFGLVAYRQLNSMAADALSNIGVHGISPTTKVATLGIGQQQLVEIAAALARDCRVLILDEPTAALTATEIEQLFVQLRSLRDRGVGIIYISHRLDEVRNLVDRVTILRDGRLVTTRPIAGLTSDAMVSLMTGDEATTDAEHASRQAKPLALIVDGLSRGNVVRDVSFTVRQGERLGIAGLVGSGRTELLRAIFGADRADAGHVVVGADLRRRRFGHPHDAVAAGLALVTEDRKQDGLLLTQSVRVNMTLNSLHRFASLSGGINAKRERMAAGRLKTDLDLRCQSVEQSAEQLSGGNQQKVIVARWLLRDATVFLLDEPTRGIDVAARARLYRLFDELAQRGKALVIVSSDLDELMQICDSIAVMSHGRLVSTLTRDNWTREKLMAATFHEMLGHRGMPEQEAATEGLVQ